MNLFSPLEIEVLLHYYYSSDPHPKHNTEGVSDIIHKFRVDGIFTDQVQPQLTDKGNAWLKTILNTPYPNQVFVDHYGNVIQL